jgi:hypothetical protein
MREFQFFESIIEKNNYGINLKKILLIDYIISCPEGFIIVRQLQNVRQNFYDRLG